MRRHFLPLLAVSVAAVWLANGGGPAVATDLAERPDAAKGTGNGIAASPSPIVGPPASKLAQRKGGMRGGKKSGDEDSKKPRGDDGKKLGDEEGETNAPRLDGQVEKDILDDETFCGIGRALTCDIEPAIKRGLFETGLQPRFPENLECRGIDEGWAISYAAKRDRVQYHGGIDMPAPFGTPMIAAATGTVVGKYRGEDSYRGIEIILRHSPEDTGLPMWTYTQYAHFDAMPDVVVGQRVQMGQVLGPTGNSGRGRNPGQQSMKRRPAIHFAVWFSARPDFVALRGKIIPVDGRWMDPNAFYRKTPPFDCYSMKALPEAEKQVPIPVMLDDGATFPADTRLVWPYTCKRR